MRKTLLTTVAAAAVVGYAAMAAAQAPGGTEQNKNAKPGGAAQEQKVSPGGAAGMQKPGQSAQAPAQGAKPEEHMGQTQTPKETTPQRGAQEEQHGKQEQRGAQEEQRGTQQQRGAQEEQRGKQEQRGAQEEQRGTQEQRGAQEENSKSGTSATERNASQSTTGKGGSVQLSQTQRSKIQTIVGKNSSARVAANVHFDVTVGAKVPRSVHVVVLPEDIVQIVPQFEGFDYVIVGDNILIIDPDTMEIVDVIPV